MSKDTKLFDGASASITKVSQRSSGTIVYAVGFVNSFAGTGLPLTADHANAELKEHGGSKQGSMKLNHSARTYIAISYAF